MSNVKNSINRRTFRFRLEAIDYRYVPMPEIIKKEEEKIRITHNDSYEIADIKTESIDIEVKREIITEPRALFDLTVSGIASYDFNEKHETKKEFNEIKKEIKKNSKELLSPAFSYISLLISNITTFSVRDLHPLITQPRYHSEITKDE